MRGYGRGRGDAMLGGTRSAKPGTLYQVTVQGILLDRGIS